MDSYSTPKKMKPLGDLFEKYSKRFKAPQASVVKECVIVIKDITGFEIEAKKIEFTVNTKTIFLNVPSILKNELKFYHPEILSKLKEKLGAETAPKIIF